jgi:hypothetical protein
MGAVIHAMYKTRRGPRATSFLCIGQAFLQSVTLTKTGVGFSHMWHFVISSANVFSDSELFCHMLLNQRDQTCFGTVGLVGAFFCSLHLNPICSN